MKKAATAATTLDIFRFHFISFWALCRNSFNRVACSFHISRFFISDIGNNADEELKNEKKKVKNNIQVDL